MTFNIFKFIANIFKNQMISKKIRFLVSLEQSNLPSFCYYLQTRPTFSSVCQLLPPTLGPFSSVQLPAWSLEVFEMDSNHRQGNGLEIKTTLCAHCCHLLQQAELCTYSEALLPLSEHLMKIYKFSSFSETTTGSSFGEVHSFQLIHFFFYS